MKEALKLALEAYLCREMPAGTIIGDPKWWVPKIAAAIKEVLAQPAPPPECKTEAEQTAYAFGWWKALESVRTEQPTQEPVAQWQKRHHLWTEGAWENAEEHDAKQWRDKAQGWEIRALYTTPQPTEPRNFCPRCGKRTADLTVIHTCTPPRGLEMT